MKEINKILVCVDLSQYSAENLEYAVELAGDSKTEILVCNIINQRDINGIETLSHYFPDDFSMGSYIKNIEKDRIKKIRAIIKEQFFNMKSFMSIHISVGTPFQEIIKLAEKEKADIIVMGNKGKGNFARTLFGSNAEKVFKHSSIPVVSVRQGKLFRKGR